MQCVDLAFDELDRMVHSLDNNVKKEFLWFPLIFLKELRRFSNLREALTEEAVNLLRKCREPTRYKFYFVIL
jgi:hypothetical protein